MGRGSRRSELRKSPNSDGKPHFDEFKIRIFCFIFKMFDIFILPFGMGHFLMTNDVTNVAEDIGACQ